MRRGTAVVLEGVLPFVATGLVFWLLYNTLFYPRTLVEVFGLTESRVDGGRA